jgi:hypothetical protein
MCRPSHDIPDPTTSPSPAYFKPTGPGLSNNLKKKTKLLKPAKNAEQGIAIIRRNYFMNRNLRKALRRRACKPNRFKSQQDLTACLETSSKKIQKFLCNLENNGYERTDFQDFFPDSDPRLDILEMLVGTPDYLNGEDFKRACDSIIESRGKWVSIYALRKDFHSLGECLWNNDASVRSEAALWLARFAKEAGNIILENIRKTFMVTKSGNEMAMCKNASIAIATTINNIENIDELDCLLHEAAKHYLDSVRMAAVKLIVTSNSDFYLNLVKELTKKEKNEEIKTIMLKYLWVNNCSDFITDMFECGINNVVAVCDDQIFKMKSICECKHLDRELEYYIQDILGNSSCG